MPFPWPFRAQVQAPPKPIVRLPTACPPLDALLGGGVESGTLTEVHGEAGTGKTNLCLQLARNVALGGGKTLYLDSEGFSPERLAQVAGPAKQQVERNLLIERVHTPSDQGRAAARAVRIARAVPGVRLVVVDSATLLYRMQLSDGDKVALTERRALLRQLHSLHAVARERGIAVVVTNQVFSLPGEQGVQGLGGHALRHLAGCVLQLQRDAEKPGMRTALLVKHRARPEGLRASFTLGPRGLEPEAGAAATAAVVNRPEPIHPPATNVN